MIRFIIKWYERWHWGYAGIDIVKVHEKMEDARDRARPFNMNKWEERALRVTTTYSEHHYGTTK